MTTIHACGKNGWAECTVCRGRIHQVGCTTRKRPQIDCCQLRHRILHDTGQTTGLDDRSQMMLGTGQTI